VVRVEAHVTPVAPGRPGNRQALDNLRERLRLAYAERGVLTTSHADGHFAVTVELPLST
jgi:hypothetical protein